MDFDEEDGSKKEDRPRRPRSILVLLVLVIVAVMLLYYGRALTGPNRALEIEFTEFLKYKADGRMDEATLDGDEIIGHMPNKIHRNDKEYEKVKASVPLGFLTQPDGFLRLAADIKPENFRYRPKSDFLYQVVLPFVPWIILILIAWYFFFRQIRATGGPGNVLSFGKSRARLITADKVKTSFNDVAGIDEAKEEVQEIIEFLKDPQKFTRLGGRIPHGVLLVGAPGTGKTLLAKAIAGEAGVPFFSIAGSDFVEMFVGVGASRVRDLFKQAKDNSPCIIFLDEIDAVGRRRGTGLGGGHDEREQTLNQILVEMDGFDTDEGVIVMAATNRPDVLDPALRRPGRFDREIVIDLPDVKGREEILRVHAKKVKLGRDVDLRKVAFATPMFSGADLANLINEAAILATMKKKESVEQEDLDEARDKVLWGRQKKSREVIEEEKRLSAYHEAGHTTVNVLLAGHTDPIHKVTIIPRGRAGGATMALPDRDRYSLTRERARAMLSFFLGGRVSEEIFLGDISTGASDDFKKTTELARSMVCEWGMSEKLGPLRYSENEEHIFLGREIARTTNVSNETQREIDAEVRRFVDEALNRARDLINANRDKVERIAKALLAYETLTGEEVQMLVAGQDIVPLKEKERLKQEKERPPRPQPETKPGWNSVQHPFPGPQQA